MTIYSGHNPLQTAAYSALTSDSSLMAIIRGVYDEVPESTPAPYVTIGEATETDNGTFGRNAWDLSLHLHVWSQAQGFKECGIIINHLSRILSQANLTLQDGSIPFLLLEHVEYLRDPDGITRHAVARFRALVEA